jgi:hypothetical protein
MKMLKLLLLAGLLAVPCTDAAADMWVEQISAVTPPPWTADSRLAVVDVATDAAGNRYVTGYFQGRATFGEVVLEGTPPDDRSANWNQNGFVAKMDPAGNWIWASQTTEVDGANHEVIGRGLAVDDSGSVYVTGRFAGQVRFGPVSLEAVDGEGYPDLVSENIFVARLDSEGHWLWAVQGGGGGTFYYTRGNSVAIDSTGENDRIYVAGTAQEAARRFGPLVKEGHGDHDVFLAELTPSGIWVWVEKYGGTGADLTGGDVAVDHAGHVWLAYEDDANDKACVTRPDRGEGSTEEYCVEPWAGGSGAMGFARGQAVAMGSDGSIYLAGVFRDDVTPMPEGCTLGPTQYGMFVVRYAGDGAPYWGGSGARCISLDHNWSSAVQLEVDNSGNVTAAVYSNTGSLRMARWNSLGNLLWEQDQQNIGSGGIGNPGRLRLGLALGPTGEPYVGGFIRVTADFASGPDPGDEAVTLDPVGEQDGFVGKLNTANGYWEDDHFQLTVGIEDTVGRQYVLRQGEAVPPPGTRWYVDGELVDASAPAADDLPADPNNPIPGSEDVFASWRGTGSVPAIGLTNEVSFIMEESSTLTWVYETLGALPLVGRAIPRPDCAAAALPPPENIEVHGLPEEEFPFLMSEPDQELYAIRPVVATIGWPRSTEPQCADGPDPIVEDFLLTWPEDMQIHIAGTPANLQPTDGRYRYLSMPYTQVTGATGELGVFRAETAGRTVLQYAETNGELYNPSLHPLRFEVVLTVAIPLIETPGGTRGADLAACTECPVWRDHVPWVIGQPIVPHGSIGHEDTLSGYVLLDRAPYDGGGDSPAHDREARTGPIVPINEVIEGIHDDLVVVWYRESPWIPGVFWGYEPVRYGPLVLDTASPLLDPNTVDLSAPLFDPNAPPPSPGRIVIASEQGTGGLDPALYPSMRIYSQPDPLTSGFNPNDEHALLVGANDDSGRNALFALRSDLRDIMVEGLAARLGLDPPPSATLPPFALLKYRDTSSQQWAFEVYEVVAMDSGPFAMTKAAEAGSPIRLPYPLSRLADCPQTMADEEDIPFWSDYKDAVWARAAGLMDVRYWYPLQTSFYFGDMDLDLDGQTDEAAGTCVPWLDRLPGGTPGEPAPVTYDAVWPADVPVLHVGETLLRAKHGLPEILNQPAAEIAFDELNPDNRVYLDPNDPLFDPNDPYAPSLARLFDPLTPRGVPLAALPAEVETRTNEQGKHVPVDLPFHLRTRLYWDPVRVELIFKGYLDESSAGEPLVLLNVMTADEKADLQALCPEPCSDPAYTVAVDDLYRLTRNPRRLDRDPNRIACDGNDRDGIPDDALLIGFQDASNPSWDPNNPFLDPNGPFWDPNKPCMEPTSDGIFEPFRTLGSPGALTAGAADGNGYITLAFNNESSLDPLPVSLNIIRVDCEPYQGEIQVIESDNVFDERLTLRHSGDFGAEPESFYFEWWRAADSGYSCLPDPNCAEWGSLPYAEGPGLNFITIEGANPTTLTDNYFIVRYLAMDESDNPLDYAYEVCSEQCSLSQAWCSENADCPGGETCDPVAPVVWGGAPGSPPAAPYPMLAEGWVKRVVRALNPFEDRANAFHASPTSTYASMLVQLGERYEGDIAFSNDPAYLNSIGLIEAYETVLRRALELGAGLDIAEVNDQILLAAGRIADFYTLLGNEGFADALDPTIGLGTDSSLGSLAPAVFGFQNQLDSLLEEELGLLRGRDDARPTGVGARPVYNRMYWNFTSGNGEVAYQQAYNITDQNGDGVIDESDARILYPQGHGDAWGHYLMAMKTYYRLLNRSDFTWVPRTEDVLVAGVPVEVDYLDERKFARAASAKAKSGAEIVDLTYRMNFVEDPTAQWQGYKDTDEERAWGVDGWARRAGQGAYLDWIVGNAILPPAEPGTCSTAGSVCYSDADCPLTETCDAPPPGTCECLPPPDSTGQPDCSSAGIACSSNTDCLGTDEVCREPAWIERIDRSTVAELDEVVSEFGRVQAHVDCADAGLNPLGLARGVVPYPLRADPGTRPDGDGQHGRRLRPRQPAQPVAAPPPGHGQRLRQQHCPAGAGLHQPSHRDLRLSIRGRHRPGRCISQRLRRAGPRPLDVRRRHRAHGNRHGPDGDHRCELPGAR